MLVLGTAEREEWEARPRAFSEIRAADVRRARLILMLAEGASYAAIQTASRVRLGLQDQAALKGLAAFCLFVVRMDVVRMDEVRGEPRGDADRGHDGDA